MDPGWGEEPNDGSVGVSGWIERNRREELPIRNPPSAFFATVVAASASER